MDGADSNDGSPWTSSPCDNDEKRAGRVEKKSNALPLWGNERTMNLNPLILTNIQSSHYFKVNLYELKTYHEVIDEIYYKVTHLEPWEKGSRKTAGQTGMCGGVRGVGAGGIVSTAYCLLYKLFTLKLTRKQVNGLLTHPDSPYIRGLGFMYLRYTQPPADLWDWYDEYLEDPEEVDCKAGGGQVMTMGEILRAFLTKLEWFSTLFPRIPVPIQQMLQRKMAERFPPVLAPVKLVKPVVRQPVTVREARHIPDAEVSFGEAERFSRLRRPDVAPVTGRAERERDRKRANSNEREDKRRGSGMEGERERERKRERRSKERDGTWRHESREGRHESREGRHESREGRYDMKEGRHSSREGRHSSREGRHESREGSGRHELKEGRHSSKEGSARHGSSHASKTSHRSRHKDHRRRDEDDDDFSEELRREKDRQSKDRHKDNGRSKHKHRS